MAGQTDEATRAAHGFDFEPDRAWQEHRQTGHNI